MNSNRLGGRLEVLTKTWGFEKKPSCVEAKHKFSCKFVAMFYVPPLLPYIVLVMKPILWVAERADERIGLYKQGVMNRELKSSDGLSPSS